MILYILAAVALVAFILPFLPGWIELKRGKDSQPLRIDMEYVRRPSFFGDNFRALLKKGLRETLAAQDRSMAGGADTNPFAVDAGDSVPLPLPPGTYTASLSMKERVIVPDHDFCQDGEGFRDIVYTPGNFRAGARSRFVKEMMVEGDMSAGPRIQARALLAGKNLTLGEGAHIVRWVDARGGRFVAGPNCRLGRHAMSAGLLELGPGCAFAALFGAPVHTVDGPEIEPPAAEGNIRESALVATPRLFSVPALSETRGNIVSTQPLKVCSGAVVYGDIKGRRSVELEDNVTVYGTIVSDADVTIGARCRVQGDIFAQGDVTLGALVIVGEAGGVKSVISRSAVRLGPGVTVHGHVSCESGSVEQYGDAVPSGEAEPQSDAASRPNVSGDVPGEAE